MSQAQNITLTLKEVYKKLCPACKKHLRSLIREKQDLQLDVELTEKKP